MATRLKNVNWSPGDEAGRAPSWERVGIAILLDIRDELQKLNALLGCSNFTAIPRVLRRISSNTAKPRKRES